MRKLKRKYKRPRRPWDATRLAEERVILKDFGLRRKSELLKASARLRNFRERARVLISTKEAEKEAALLQRLHRLGLLQKGAGLDDVLALNIMNILERRLQTQVMRKGYAKTPMQARQLITHGKVTIDGRKVVYPSYMVTVEDETRIKVIEDAREGKRRAENPVSQTKAIETRNDEGQTNEDESGESADDDQE